MEGQDIVEGFQRKLGALVPKWPSSALLHPALHPVGEVKAYNVNVDLLGNEAK